MFLIINSHRLSVITLLCRGPLKSHKSTLALSYVQQMLQCQIPGTGWWTAAEWEKGSNPSGGLLFISFSCGFRSVQWWCAAVPLISWWRQWRSPQPCGTRVYLLLSQVSQPGTEHLKEALTLLWIRLTWFMWAGCGFASLLWHSVFHVRLFMRIWRWVLRAHGCSLKRRYDLGLGLIPDESESTSRWISCSTLNTHKNMLHEAPHLGNRKEFESRLILWTVIFPRRHLHAPGITGLWGDYRQGKKGYKSKKLFIFTQGTRAHTSKDK